MTDTLLRQLFLNRTIQTPVYFFDETGLLNNATDKFFILGMVKSLRPHNLTDYIRNLRDKAHFYDEIKWKKVNAKNLPIMKQIVDEFFRSTNNSFACIVLDKAHMDFEKHFNNDFFKAYKSFSVLLLKKSITPNEIVTVIADYYSTPAKDEFEATVRNFVNDHTKELLIHSIIRIHSKGCDMIQLADLLMGAVNYEFKLKNKLILKPNPAKVELLEHIKNELKVNDLARALYRDKFNIILFSPAVKRNLQAMGPTANA